VLLDEGALWRYVYAPITIATRALEQAPNYSKAQDLLLRIRSTRPPGND